MLSQQVFPDIAYGSLQESVGCCPRDKTDDEGQHCVDKKQATQL